MKTIVLKRKEGKSHEFLNNPRWCNREHSEIRLGAREWVPLHLCY